MVGGVDRRAGPLAAQEVLGELVPVGIERRSLSGVALADVGQVMERGGRGQRGRVIDLGVLVEHRSGHRDARDQAEQGQAHPNQGSRQGLAEAAGARPIGPGRFARRGSGLRTGAQRPQSEHPDQGHGEGDRGGHRVGLELDPRPRMGDPVPQGHRRAEAQEADGPAAPAKRKEDADHAQGDDGDAECLAGRGGSRGVAIVRGQPHPRARPPGDRSREVAEAEVDHPSDRVMGDAEELGRGDYRRDGEHRRHRPHHGPVAQRRDPPAAAQHGDEEYAEEDQAQPRCDPEAERRHRGRHGHGADQHRAGSPFAGHSLGERRDGDHEQAGGGQLLDAAGQRVAVEQVGQHGHACSERSQRPVGAQPPGQGKDRHGAHGRGEAQEGLKAPRKLRVHQGSNRAQRGLTTARITVGHELGHHHVV